MAVVSHGELLTGHVLSFFTCFWFCISENEVLFSLPTPVKLSLCGDLTPDRHILSLCFAFQRRKSTFRPWTLEEVTFHPNFSVWSKMNLELLKSSHPIWPKENTEVTAPSLHHLEADRLIALCSLKERGCWDESTTGFLKRVSRWRAAVDEWEDNAELDISPHEHGGLDGLGMLLSWVVDGSNNLEGRARAGRHELAGRK